MGNSKETPRIVELLEVIHVVAARGKGIDNDPMREVHQYWSKQGELLAERDFYLESLFSIASNAPVGSEL